MNCVRNQLPPGVLATAAARADRTGVGADRVLVTQGDIDDETYVRALAGSLGAAFEPMDNVTRAQCPIDDARLCDAAATGLLPLMIDGSLALVLAPRLTAARRLTELAAEDPNWGKRFLFTSGKRLERFIVQHAGDALIARARDRLKLTTPKFSAAAQHRPARWRAQAAVMALGIAAAFAPSTTAVTVELALAFLFMAWLTLRLTAAFLTRPMPAPLVAIPDARLPVYTVIAALYREANSVPGLLRALERLDYPLEKLDIILAIEADDEATLAAIENAQPRFPVTVVPVPASEPRTKPKALNVALSFARGTFTVVYDAEDRPEPDQLRRAVEAFQNHGDELACVQARLCIDNTADTWITRLFTAEYAAQFDIFLDGLTRLGLPLPLGGSSNHFYTDVLRKVGAWDPYNVTEDADLGMRLARYGYRAAMINSSTYEEAPAYFGPWLRQRTRWFKGWMQTWIVHMREPLRLLRDLGPGGFVAFQLVVGGNVLAALVHPIFLASLIMIAAGHSMFGTLDAAALDAFALIYSISALSGYTTSALTGWLGLNRRGLLTTSWALLLTPLNWLMLSVAAWRALYQIAVRPYRWEKTEHGLARTSRQADELARSLRELEQYLRRLRQTDVSRARSLGGRRRRADGGGLSTDQSRPDRPFSAAARRDGLAPDGELLSSESA